MNKHYEDELRIAERAAEWHGVLGRTGPHRPREQEYAEFMAWLTESPKHIREFLLLQAWEIETQGVDSQREISVDEIVRKLSANVVSLKQGERHDPKTTAASLDLPSSSRENRVTRIRWRWVAGLAAALAVAAVLSWQLYQGRTYSTAIGELRTVELADGSKIELNTASQVHVNFTNQLREVQLVQGEALFKVQHDTHRPFRVYAGASVIQAVGTQFTVDRRPLGTIVAVIEGKVRVYTSPLEHSLPTSVVAEDTRGILIAGEQARLDPRGQIQKREPIADTNATVWRQRRLVFRDDALADIAAEFNRYNRKLQIVVEGETARNKRYGGIFDADDPESIVRFIVQDGDLSVIREKGRTVIRSR